MSAPVLYGRQSDRCTDNVLTLDSGRHRVTSAPMPPLTPQPRNRLKVLRAERNLRSALRLGELIGVRRNRMVRIELEETKPTPEECVRLVDVMNALGLPLGLKPITVRDLQLVTDRFGATRG